MQADNQTGKHTWQAGRQTDRQSYKQAVIPECRKADISTGRHAYRQGSRHPTSRQVVMQAKKAGIQAG